MFNSHFCSQTCGGSPGHIWRANGTPWTIKIINTEHTHNTSGLINKLDTQL